MSILRKLDRWLINIQEFLATLLMVLITIIVLIQVVLRYFLAVPCPWAEEFARLGLVWASFIAASLGLRTFAHPRMNALIDHVPRVFRQILNIIIYSTILVMAYVMVYYGRLYYIKTIGDYTTSLSYARNVFYLPVPICGVIIAIYCVVWIVENIVGLIKKTENKHEESEAVQSV